MRHFHDIFLDSELAAELYVDDLVDGQGMPQFLWGLTPATFAVRLDNNGRVTAVEHEHEGYQCQQEA